MDDLFPEQNAETAALLILVITAQIVANPNPASYCAFITFGADDGRESHPRCRGHPKRASRFGKRYGRTSAPAGDTCRIRRACAPRNAIFRIADQHSRPDCERARS